MRKMLMAAMFVGVLGLLMAAPAVAADYPPSCDSTTATSPSTDATSQTCATNGDPTLFVAGASGQGSEQNALAFTGSSNTTPLVVAGITAVVIGTLFVVASRRRAVPNS